MKKSILIAFLFFLPSVNAQIPAELFFGDKKATLDVLFFKPFRDSEGKNSDWVLFNRGKVTLDYKMTPDDNKPFFVAMQAVSYSPPALGGFGPVAVSLITNDGMYPKLGLQYVKGTSDFLFFGWLICETLKDPDVDLYLFARYTPLISGKTRLFTQIETNSAFPAWAGGEPSLFQCLRLGLMWNGFQTGIAIDLTQKGKNDLKTTENSGVFVRYEF
ncbi:hypothetical protein MASR1M107_30170 [Ignavibacteriales bacterium]